MNASQSGRAVYDLAIVGAGILGLAAALAAARAGKRVVVIDRDARANGASVRNFGFITVTGQQRGECWGRAMRSRDVWADVAPKADIRIEHAGLAVVARRPEARDVLAAFAASEMGAACELLDGTTARRRFPELSQKLEAVLYSPHDLRVESRDAIPKLAAYLERLGVTFMRETSVSRVAPPTVTTSRGEVAAGSAIVCAGDDFTTLFARRLTPYRLLRCKVQMLRVAPGRDCRLSCAVMSDLSLVRYLGYAEMPQAQTLRRRLEAEQAEHLAHGIHLIAVGSNDGTMVVGDSHDYATTPDPFVDDHVEGLMLDEYRAVFGHTPAIVQRWFGTYAWAPDRLALVDAPAEDVRIAIVTSGTGASTGFAIGEEIVRDLLGVAP